MICTIEVKQFHTTVSSIMVWTSCITKASSEVNLLRIPPTLGHSVLKNTCHQNSRLNHRARQEPVG